MDQVYPLNLTRGGVPIAGWLASARADEIAALERGLDRILHPAEAAHLAGFRYPRRRLSYLLGRACAKRAVAGALPGTEPSSIEIASGVFGQPLVLCAARDVPEVSLSHSGDVAVAVAVQAGHCVGVDLERIDPSHTGLLVGQLTPAEAEQLRRRGLDPESACWHVWTIKEALSKTLRCGMTVPWSILELEGLKHDGRGAFGATFTNFGQYRAASWALEVYVLSIVLPRQTAMRFDPRGLVLPARDEGGGHPPPSRELLPLDP